MNTPLDKIRCFFNPERFQGWGKTRDYFEGWYFKLLDARAEVALAVIPGIAYDAQGRGHAFVQVLDGVRRTALYHRFGAEEFRPSAERFEVEVGGSRFSEEGLRLDLPGLRGELRFSGNVPWPKPAHSPGIMGPFAFVPRMECYHGIVSMDHRIEGSLEHDGRTVDFGGGRGYIEKDWGRSFPSAYVWMQTNHFEGSTGSSIKCSVANIPWMGSSFVGFIGGLWHDGRLHRFTTYNGSRLLKADISSQKVELVLANRHERLDILATPDKASALVSPIRGAMEGKIEESMGSRLRVRLSQSFGRRVLFEGESQHTALEIAGAIERLQT